MGNTELKSDRVGRLLTRVGGGARAPTVGTGYFLAFATGRNSCSSKWRVNKMNAHPTPSRQKYLSRMNL
jgi:hypothetical protein